MILVRTVLQATFGRGAEVAQLAVEVDRRLAKETGWGGRWRVLTDLSGPFDTVVLETVVESLAAWERLRAELFSQPAFRDAMPKLQELVQSGRAEYYTIEAES